MIIIAKDGSGDFDTLQAAIDAVPEEHAETIHMLLKKGIYREKIIWNKSGISLTAEDGAQVVWGDYALQLLPDGTTKNTFLTATMLISGDDNRLENLTIINDAGDGRQVGQAVALYAAGDRCSFFRCRLIACQDTLYCGPTLWKTARWSLPYKLPQGAESVSVRPPVDARQYFQDCYIQGDVDFIFGPYRVWFEGCTLHANARGGYYTAANTPEGQPYGFVFHRCHLTGDCGKGGMYLGRPWRDFARTAFLDCTMEECVHPSGFCDWEEPFRPVTPLLCEYASQGPGAPAGQRHPNMALMSDTQAEYYTMEKMFMGWQPG